MKTTPMTRARSLRPVVVLTTFDNRPQAERMARVLVERRLAACVNIIGGVRSIYRWQDAVESTDEILLLIKTQQNRVEAVRTLVHQLHSYDVPEFLVLKAESGSDAYLAWLAANVS